MRNTWLASGALCLLFLTVGACGDESDDKVRDTSTGGNVGSGGGGGEAATATCAERSKLQCESDDEVCALVRFQQVSVRSGTETCSLGQVVEVCTEADGPNCSDADAEAFWTNDHGEWFKTNDSCGLPDFERLDHWSYGEACAGLGGAGGVGGAEP